MGHVPWNKNWRQKVAELNDILKNVIRWCIEGCNLSIYGTLTQLENVLKIVSESYITQEAYFLFTIAVSKIMVNIYMSDIQVIFQLYGHFKCLQVIYSR